MESSLSFFYNDYEEVAQMSADFDAQIQSAASGNVTSNYAALCAIAARQVYSGLEITVGKDASGNYNTSDTMVFVKGIAFAPAPKLLLILCPLRLSNQKLRPATT